jgi:hypothetical protein
VIASVQISSKGSEGNIVYCYPASGLKILDVSLNGVSISYWQSIIDETLGKITLEANLEYGDLVKVIYKTLPKVATVTSTVMVDFESADFESADFT